MKCLTPTIKEKIIKGIGYKFQYPCGKCDHCRRTKQSQIKLRLLLETTLSPNNAFVTFTYNDIHVPQELQKDDAQRLLKRLRKQVKIRYGDGATFKHYLVGEYGSRTGRPHFHAILFGYPYQDHDTLAAAWRRNVGSKRKPLYASLGFVHSREVTAARAGYLVKYTTKFLESNSSSNGDKCEEFAIMSKRSGGIGLGYLHAITSQIRKARNLYAKNYTLADYFDNYVGSLTVGHSRCSIDPYLRSKIYKYLHEKDAPSNKESISEGVKRDRKAERRKAMNATRRMPLSLDQRIEEDIKRRDASITAKRKQRETLRKIKIN